MLSISKIPRRFDDYQKRHTGLSFLIAVLKKYGDDQAGNQAALITYYAFVSLFPLLLVFFTVLGSGLKHHAQLQERIINSVLQYFPVIGQQLQNNIHGIHRAGLSLVVEIIIVLYGARGVANTLQNACNHLWDVPPKLRPGFPSNLIRSMELIVGGGLGLVLTTTGLSYATGIGHRSALVKLPLVVIALLLNCLVFLLVFRIATAPSIKTKSLILGAVVSAVFWQILQTIGSFLVLHEFREASAVYGIFALVLGLLFWFYIQTQFTLYAMEINIVRVKKLWPRSIT